MPYSIGVNEEAPFVFAGLKSGLAYPAEQHQPSSPFG
jgi:hypothetical protein